MKQILFVIDWLGNDISHIQSANRAGVSRQCFSHACVQGRRLGSLACAMFRLWMRFAISFLIKKGQQALVNLNFSVMTLGV